MLSKTVPGIGTMPGTALFFMHQRCQGWIQSGKNLLEGAALNLEQALTANGHRLVYRQQGNRRVIVERQQYLLTIHFQRRRKRHWIIDDEGESVRYLGGIVRDGLGRYLSLCLSDDLSTVDQIRAVLPLCYQDLLLPMSNDWLPLEGGNQ